MTVQSRSRSPRLRLSPLPMPISGFTLIELMIAMVLGVLIIGAVGTVFLSTQQSYRLKTDFENTQEAFRFASHAVMRVVQTSQSVISEDSNGARLSVDILGREGAVDCVGIPVPEGDVFRNTFFVQNGILFCRSEAAGTETAAGTVTEFELVSGVSAITFRYADTDDQTAPLNAGDYKDPAGSQPIQWDNVRSVRTTLQMVAVAGGNALEFTFTSTSRGAAIGDSIIVSPN